MLKSKTEPRSLSLRMDFLMVPKIAQLHKETRYARKAVQPSPSLIRLVPKGAMPTNNGNPSRGLVNNALEREYISVAQTNSCEHEQHYFSENTCYHHMSF